MTRKNGFKIITLLVLGSLVLSGCVNSAPTTITPVASPAPTGFSEYYEQQVMFEPCGERIFCAEIEAPMDWSDSQSPSVKLALAYRLAESTPMGFVLFNPGGPGVSGYDWVVNSSEYLGTKTLRSNFNILGFDPRGVGKSSAVSCLTDLEYDEFLYGVSGFELGSDEDISAARKSIADFVSKCQENTGDLLGFVDTVSAAKDMDLMRAVLGEEKLNFLGYSYGSLLGTTYATLFPDRVGRFVLDGAIDPTVSDSEQTLLQIQAFENSLRAFLQNCSLFEDCPFSGEVDKDLKEIQELLLALETRPLSTASGREVTVWVAVTGLIMPLYSDSYWQFLSTAFDQAFRGSGDMFLALADTYNDRGADGRYTTNLIAANYAINCLDSRASANLFEMKRQNNALLEVAPTIGRYWQYGGLRCESWPYDVVPKPTGYSALGAPTIMVIGTTGDPATPYSQAQALANQILASGFLVTYNGEGHTIYGRQVSCIDQVVDKFFTTGNLPASDPNC